MSYDVWLEALSAASETVRSHLPALAAAALLVLAGWLLALVGRRWARALSERLLVRLGTSTSAIGKAVESSAARGVTPRVIAGFVYWLIFLGFLAAAVEVLGLPVMTDLLGRLAAYAPNILAAILIALGGLITARVVRSAALRALEASGIAQALGIATIAEGLVVVLASVIALEQLGVNGRVLELMVAVTVGSGLAAVALSFGLGARSLVANLVAAHFVGRLVQVGQSLSINDVEGTVIELTPTAVVVKTAKGRVVVPAQHFQESCSVIEIGRAHV